MKKLLSISFLVPALLFSSGCASTIAIGSRCVNGNPQGEIYPATRLDIHAMQGLWEAGSWAILCEPFPILDIPFSLITDTLILPYDIYSARKRITENR